MIYESSTCWLRVSEGRQHTGWQGRADDDKTGAGMRQPWGGGGRGQSTQGTYLVQMYNHSHGSGGFRGMDWTDMGRASIVTSKSGQSEVYAPGSPRSRVV